MATDSGRRLSAKRRWLFRIVAMLLPVFLLVCLEVTLRILGTGYPTSFLIPHPTEDGVLVDNYRFAWRFFPPALARSPQPIRVQKIKPEGTTRILVFGGSAAMGDPEPAYGFPRILEVLLRERFPQRDFELVNCAVTAVNSHVVREIAKDCRQLNADVWIVYLGNNEVHGPFGIGTVFGNAKKTDWVNRAALVLNETKLGQAAFALRGAGGSEAPPQRWGGMEMFVDQQVRFNDPAMETVYRQYEANLTSIVRSARNTPVVLATVATNVLDFPPFISQHEPALSSIELEQWDGYFKIGCEQQHAGQHRQALEAFAEAANIDPHFAELEFRQGMCHRELGAMQEARTYFVAARDHDTLRFRADSRINSVVRTIGGSTPAALVDVEASLANLGDHTALGDDVLYEHVHLNFHGNYLVAKMLANEVVRQCGIATDSTQTDDSVSAAGWASEDRCSKLLGRSVFHQRLTWQDVLGRISSPPFTGQAFQRDRAETVRLKIRELSGKLSGDMRQSTLELYQSLLKDHVDDWVLRKQFGLFLDSIGELEAAGEQFRFVRDFLPHHAESSFRYGAQLNRMGQREAAADILRQTLLLRPDFARAHNSLGICLSHLGDFADAYEHFEKATTLQPSFAEAFVNWGLVLANRDQTDLAVEKYKQAVEADESFLPARVKLGKYYVDSNNYQDAMPHYEAIAGLRPQDAAAQLNLGMLYVRFGGHEQQARRQFELVLEIDPKNELARAALANLDNH